MRASSRILRGGGCRRAGWEEEEKRGGGGRGKKGLELVKQKTKHDGIRSRGHTRAYSTASAINMTDFDLRRKVGRHAIKRQPEVFDVCVRSQSIPDSKTELFASKESRKGQRKI